MGFADGWTYGWTGAGGPEVGGEFGDFATKCGKHIQGHGAGWCCSTVLTPPQLAQVRPFSNISPGWFTQHVQTWDQSLELFLMTRFSARPHLKHELKFNFDTTCGLIFAFSASTTSIYYYHQ